MIVSITGAPAWEVRQWRARACEEIRSTWSEREHRRRAGWSRELVGFAGRWTVPEFDARQIGLIEGQRLRGDF
jgi:hypothetical protein